MATTLDKKLTSILEIARYAPSVHNTQPWKVDRQGDVLRISIDPRYKLGSGDPTGRETIISLGIFVEALCGAALEQGFLAKHVQLEGGSATIHLKEAKSHSQTNPRFSSLLRNRHTNRNLFLKEPLDQGMQASIEKVGATDHTDIHVATSREIIDTTAKLTSKAISVALSDPAFRSELASYLRLPWSSNHRGISVLSLGIPTFIAVFEPLFMRLGWGLKLESKIERMRWESSSAIVFITAKGDMPKFWFNAGRTYLRVCLEIERLGLSQATSAAIVEASNYHDDIEELIGTKDRILAVIRVGRSKRPGRHSPRISADELLH